MAYNLQSLINILHQLLDPEQTRWILDDNKAQLEFLLHQAASLQQILEKSSITITESLECQIRDAAHKAEDIIEPEMAHQTVPRLDLQQVMQQLDSAKDQAVKLAATGSSNKVGLDEDLSQLKDCLTRIQSKLKTIPVVGAIGQTTLHDLDQVMQQLDSVMNQVVNLTERKKLLTGSLKSVVVGMDKDLKELKERLTGMSSKLEIVPIVGMGGIGKTTLARQLYQDPVIVDHFKYLAWTIISQDYDYRAVLLGLLGYITGKQVDQHTRKKNTELGDILYKSLYGRRYMIVFDDIWSTTFWDEIRRYLPDNNNGSRIVITTRESLVAEDINLRSKQHEMHLLNKSESWNLLRNEVFGDQEDCPPVFERIGRNIAINCGGLPLAICVVGGLLSKANTTQDIWEKVANDVRAAIAESDQRFSNILSLSYDQLPSHLKPCFLYMGAFHENYEIKASRLIRLWVAEGFLKQNGDKSLEEEAEDCLKALVARNLVSIRAFKSDGRAKRYGMHDLMRDLCLKKAEEQRFVHAGSNSGDATYSLRRVSVHRSYEVRDIRASPESMAFARSFLFTGLASHTIISSVFFGLRLLRVLDIFNIEFQNFPLAILHIPNLRFLAFSCTAEGLPSDISKLCNLQTLVICAPRDSIFLPVQIWEMAELRHVVVYKAKIDYFSLSDFIQEKLQTISSISSVTAAFLARIPNIRKLGIDGRLHCHDFYNLQKLESLKFCGSEQYLHRPFRLRLPLSLNKLSLEKCRMSGEFIKHISELPNLEVLKLQECRLEGGEPREWDATQLVFSKLQFLLLERLLQLVRWRADETNFPRLRRLVIRGCSALEEIPFHIGEIPTLQTIELDEHCSTSLVASARLIIEEQRDNGNDDLQLRV